MGTYRYGLTFGSEGYYLKFDDSTNLGAKIQVVIVMILVQAIYISRSSF